MDDNLTGGRGGNRSLSKAGLTVGTDVAKLNTVATLDFAIDGITYNKTAATNVAFTAGHTALTNNQICTFGVWIDSAGNFTTTQSVIASATDVAAGNAAVPLPDLVENKALVGLVKVKTAIATFTPGTTNLTATNVTNTYYDCSVLPSKPFTS